MIDILKATIFYLGLSVLLLMPLVCVFWIMIWKQKRGQDKNSYKKIYHNDHVKTCLTPDEYIEECSHHNHLQHEQHEQQKRNG